MNDNAKTIMAFFAGIAVGATLGILLAPDKGSDLREQLGDSLKKTGDDLISKINNSICQAKEKLTKKANEVLDNIETGV